MHPSIPLFPEQASTMAARVDNLYFFMVATSAFFAVLVTLLVIAFAIRFRRRSPDGVGEPIHGSLALELIWTGIPFVIAMVMFVWGASVYFALARMPDEAFQRGVFKSVFTFALPMLLVSNVPVRLLVNTLTSPKLLLLLGMAILCPLISEWVWRISVRRYTSASS